MIALASEVLAQYAGATNATGWTELFEGNLIGAAYNAYDGPLRHFTVAILFFVYQFMLIIKTRNFTLAWVTGLFFASLYAVSSFVKTISIQIIFVLLVFELAGILYVWFYKK